MARIGTRKSGYRVVVVDDDDVLLESTVALLTQQGHEVASATDASVAVDRVRATRPHVVLLDYHLGGATGADVVRAIRAFDPLVQILLVTGYASEQPARRMLTELDIQGYHDKSDGPERLLVLLDATLKHAATVLRLDRHRRVLRRLLDLGVAVSRLASVEVIFTEALEGVAALLGASSSTGFVATENHGVLVTRGADERVALRATRGRFEPVRRCSLLPQPVREAVGVALASTRPRLEDGFVVVPLATSDGERGCIVVESPCLPEEAVEPLGIYARHVTQALENAVLFERATVDPLTELFNRRFGLHRLDETLRLGARAGTPTAVLLLDLDHFKRVNDEHGHAAGDVVLRTVAETVRRTLRSTDVVARYGGEELFAVLPCTGALQALEAAERVRSAVEAVRVAFEGRSLRVTTSIGAAAGAPGVADGGALLREADRALYAAKQGGRNRVGAADAHARMAS